MTDKYIEEFKEILPDSFEDMTYEEDSVESKYDGKYKVVSRKEGENRRWNRAVNVVVEFPDGRLFSWEYDEPLTEYGEFEFPWDFHGENWKPVEVEHYTETIVVDKFRAKENS